MNLSGIEVPVKWCKSNPYHRLREIQEDKGIGVVTGGNGGTRGIGDTHSGYIDIIDITLG